MNKFKVGDIVTFKTVEEYPRNTIVNNYIGERLRIIEIIKNEYGEGLDDDKIVFRYPNGNVDYFGSWRFKPLNDAKSKPVTDYSII